MTEDCKPASTLVTAGKLQTADSQPPTSNIRRHLPPSIGIWAQTYYMTIHKHSGAPETYPIQDIQKLTFYGVVSVEDYDKLKDALSTFVLLQNYPNPFNPITKIEFNIPVSTNVEVNIFDINGRLIRTLMNDFIEKGYHQTVWDAKNDLGQLVTSGVYIYHIKTDNQIISKKMLFIK